MSDRGVAQPDELEALGLTPYFAAQFELLGRGDLHPCRVRSDSRGLYHLHGGLRETGELSGKLRYELAPIERPVTGDWVAVSSDGIIEHVCKRRTALYRRAAGSSHEAQVIAANVDVFFIVTSATREFNLARVERYLTAVWDSGAEPVVVLNKIDSGEDVEERAAQLASLSPMLEVVSTSASSGEGIENLASFLGVGKTIGFIGSSGVGKSTLINCLRGESRHATRETRRDDKGRHTTTRRELVVLATGGVLVDTPGMRELGLVADSDSLAASFADIAALAQSCRFADCRHQEEPGCAVRVAVSTGDLAEQRLTSYHKQLREIAAAERLRDPLMAGRQKRRWKSIHKSLRARAKVDPKLQS